MFKFSKKVKSFKKSSPRLNLDLYWKLAVGFMCIVAILSAVFGYYLFVEMDQEFVASSEGQTSQLATVKKGRIDKALEYFSLRKKKSEQILSSPAPVVDPSL